MSTVPRLRQLTIDDGLPSSRIHGIAEDRTGTLWIATGDGLASYDGTGFRVWQAEDGLRDNLLWAVHVDARNRVWVGTDRAGLAMLDVDRTHFRFYDRSNTPSMGSDRVWSIASTPDGALWFGTSPGGLHRLDVRGRVDRFMPAARDAGSLPGAEVGQLAVSAKGELWVGTLSGAARWTGTRFERVPATALKSPHLNGLTVEPDGTVWFGTDEGVSVRHPGGTYGPAPTQDPAILQLLLRDRSGLRWFDILKGLGFENGGKAEVAPLYSQASHGLVRPSWVSAFEDHEGGLWFVSYTHGLWYLNPDWRQFAVLTRRVGDRTTMANAQVNGIAPTADGGMWLVGNGGSLDRLDPDTGHIRHVIDDDQRVSGGLSWQHVLQDRRGQVWVTFAGGVARIDPRSGRYVRWLSNDARAPILGSLNIPVETPDGRIWLIDEQGSAQARDYDGRILESLPAGSDGGLPREMSVAQTAPGPDGALWVAGSQGLFAWNALLHRFEPVPGVDRRETHAFAWKGNDVWLARFGALQPYRWQGPGLIPLPGGVDTRHGMPLIAAEGIVIDAEGILWVTSMRGLIRADPARQRVRVYGVRDGLPSQELAEAPVARGSDGLILVGTPEGLVMFQPRQVRPNDNEPRLALDTIEVHRDGRRVRFDAGVPFRLRHDDRDLRIVARLLSFNDARHHLYRSRLVGFDTEWVNNGASGERVFSQLPPGRYRLEFQARGADQVWSQPQSVSFAVSPPWWQTWTATAGFAGLALLVGWWTADVYRRRLKRRHAWQWSEHEREVAEQASLAKTRFLATLGHEVRTPMTGVLGMSELLMDTPLDQQQRGYVDSIRRAGRHLLRLVNDALDLARIESGRLELADAPFDLRTVVDEAATLMAPLARQRGLSFLITVDPDAPRGLRGDVNRVCQILLNLLANAIKFTEQGSVSLRVSALSPQGVRFEIADTGPGLSEEQQAWLFRRFEQAEGARTAARYGGSGLGLAICQELTAEMGGTIGVESAPGEGARFLVELPLPSVAAPDAHDGAEALLAARGGPLSLLLVEDDPTVAEVICGLLRAQGHRVVHVAHALAALAEATTGGFDAALLDLDLPGMDGFALAQQLRLQGFTRPLLGITARADAEVEPQATAAGFQGFLRKPVTGGMLAGLLASVPGRQALTPAPLP
ncbi:hybrid sensor histidine kinase/response regulator [Lysobacter sp. MMG2]|uniref:hybrid sensor histidine kinase/response regulator n=1 Tax=Lysobacter sp. MMG2 TaxID=2801338 RepID=UPI0020B230D0|nr:hybrid sensor histidine kinase/response regulator [Lysobacter sp. MMG2]